LSVWCRYQTNNYRGKDREQARHRSKTYPTETRQKQDNRIIQKKKTKQTTYKMEAKFNKVYSTHTWGRGSGPGSKFTADNKWFLNELRTIIDNNPIKTICDAGCGDWEIMKHMEWKEDERYVGTDVVGTEVEKLQHNYETDNITFKQQDISTDVPSGYDLVIIKDVIQHWDDDIIVPFLRELIQNNKYVYCVNGFKFMRDTSKNDVFEETGERELDKKYHYHPIRFDVGVMEQFDEYIYEQKQRRAKEYNLFSQD